MRKRVGGDLTFDIVRGGAKRDDGERVFGIAMAAREGVREISRFGFIAVGGVGWGQFTDGETGCARFHDRRVSERVVGLAAAFVCSAGDCAGVRGVFLSRIYAGGIMAIEIGEDWCGGNYCCGVGRNSPAVRLVWNFDDLFRRTDPGICANKDGIAVVMRAAP